ncbi:MAG: prepilin-type N-terminal cleavage/methylation domain-containing protein [Desulfobulbaceae bacterium]|jgi:general secretion pathway protein I|nr:prepilin-type N-terminal cleavage/methylation domain-containing protein [Desulfobulbaceae bacterium]
MRDNEGRATVTRPILPALNSSGFTFLEVLVAVAIIAIAFVTLIGSQSQSVSVAGDSRFNVDAALLAQQKLAELAMADFDDVYSETGNFEETNPAYWWRTEVRDVYDDETGIPGSGELLKLVELTITLSEEGRQAYVVRTLVMRKPEAESQ